MKTQKQIVAEVFRALANDMASAKYLAGTITRQRSRERVRYILLDVDQWLTASRAVLKFVGDKTGALTTEAMAGIQIDDLKIAAKALKKARTLVSRGLVEEGEDLRAMKATARSIVFTLDEGLGFAEAVARQAGRGAGRSGNPKLHSKLKSRLL